MIEAMQVTHPSFANWLDRQYDRIAHLRSIPLMWWIVAPVAWPIMLCLCLILWCICFLQMRNVSRRISALSGAAREFMATVANEDDNSSVEQLGLQLTKRTASLFLYWHTRLEDVVDNLASCLATVSEWGWPFYPHEKLCWLASEQMDQLDDALCDLAEVHGELRKRWPVSGIGDEFMGCLETAEILADDDFSTKLVSSIEQFRRGETIPWSDARETLGL